MGVFNGVLQSCLSFSLLGALVVLVVVYLVSTGFFTSARNDKGPPGPKPLPVLGNLLQLDMKNLYSSLLELSGKYGSVFSVYLGPKKVVVLAGYQTVKEALVTNAEVFGERDPPASFAKLFGNDGVLWSNGDSWREMRRFALSKLRDFGMGRRVCEDKILQESHFLSQVLTSFQGEPFDTTAPLQLSISNIICSMVFGHRFEYHDPVFTAQVERTCRNALLAGSPSLQLYNLFPTLGKVFANKEFFKIAQTNQQQNRTRLTRLKETLNPQKCRGLVDAFLVHKGNLEESGVTNNNFHDKNLLAMVSQLFAAGTDTTATTIRWALLLMAKYPKIQDQVHEELDRVVGSRQVQLEDRKNLPFVDAVIHETQRMANIAPMSLPHKTSRDVTFQGFFIEKGTTVWPLLMSVLYDESQWERPRCFYPAHFLDQDGKFLKRDAFMAFSAGRRVCLGEGLARMELFLFFSTLLQRFRFAPEPGVSEEDLDLTPWVGLTLFPAPHKLCAIPI